MGQFITKEKLGEILNKKPPDVTPESILETLANQGNEIEGYNAKFSPLDAVKNIPGSTLELGKNIYAAVANPMQTAKSIGNVALGGLAKLVPGEQDSEKAFNNVLDFYEQRYGSADKFLNTVERDPVGFASDLASLLSGGGAALKVGSKIASIAGKAGAATKLAAFGKTAAQIGGIVDPLSIAGGAVKVTGKAIRPINEALGINRVLRESGGRMMQSALGFTKSQAANLAKKARLTKSPGEHLAEWGITGTPEQISTKLDDVIKNSKKAVDDALAADPAKYRAGVVNDILTELDNITSGLKSSRFAAVRSEIQNLLNQHTMQGLNLSEMNQVKRILDDLQSEQIFKPTGELKSSLQKKDLGYMRQELRALIEKQATKNGIPDIGKINGQTAFAQSVKKIVDDNIRAGYHRRALIDRILAGTAAGAAIWALSNPKFLIGALGIYVPLKLLRSSHFQTNLATKLRLLTDGEFKALEGGVKIGKVTTPARNAVRKAFTELRQIYPEIRLAGIVKEETTKNEE